MLDWLPNPTAFAVFLVIAGIGFVFLLISLLFGEIFEHLGGAFDHDLDHGGPGFFSTRILSVFVTAFGGFGAVGVHYGLSTLGASGLGFASGAFFASLIYLFARFLYGQQASTDVRSADILGQTARVVVAIPAGGVGQVRCKVGEELIDKIAQSNDQQAIPENTTVRIEEVLGGSVIVRRQ
jgi:membrane protein implicated in regulation of membrane protease activity